MIRGVGILVGLALIAAAILQAVARDWTIDGIFLLLAGVGLLMLLLAALTTYESIDETHPDALGSLDLLARRPETTAGGNPSPGTRTPDA